jgi:RDD family
VTYPPPPAVPPLQPVPAPRPIGASRRFAARTLDWLLMGTASAILCWPIAWQVLTDAAQRRGTSVAWDVVSGSADLSGAAADFVGYARTVILLTLIGQVVLVAAYEWLCLAATGTTLGKAILGIQVVLPEVDGVPIGRGARFGRFGARALLGVLPGGLAVAFFGVAVIGVDTGWLLGLAFLLLAGLDFLPTRPTADARQCLHDRAAGSLVVSRRLAQLAKDASAQAATMAQQAWNAPLTTRGRARLDQARQSELAQRAAARSRDSWDRARSSSWGQRAESSTKKTWRRFRHRRDGS